MSSHLPIHVKAGILGSERNGRSTIYRINFIGTREPLSFLMEDCCQSFTEACQPAIESVLLDHAAKEEVGNP